MKCQAPKSTPAATTLTSTSSGPNSGRATSRKSSTSADPYLSCTIAFIRPHLIAIRPTAPATVVPRSGPRQSRRSRLGARPRPPGTESPTVNPPRANAWSSQAVRGPWPPPKNSTTFGRRRAARRARRGGAGYRDATATVPVAVAVAVRLSEPPFRWRKSTGHAEWRALQRCMEIRELACSSEMPPGEAGAERVQESEPIADSALAATPGCDSRACRSGVPPGPDVGTGDTACFFPGHRRSGSLGRRQQQCRRRCGSHRGRWRAVGRCLRRWTHR